MPATKDSYRISAITPEAMSLELNFVLARLADRMDKMEGIRGTAAIASNLEMNANRVVDIGAGLSTADAARVGQLPDISGLTSLTLAALGGLLYPTLGTETGVVYEYYPYGDVRRFGAVADDTLENGTTAATTDNATAFNNAWASIKATGGRLYIPPGKYYLNATWLLDVDLTLPHNYVIESHGATIRNGPSVTGFAVQVYGSYNYHGVKIYGLHINHRNNPTAAGGIQVKGASNGYYKDICVELYSNSATWTAFELAAITPGDGNTHSFWNVFEQCSTRKRAGADGGSGVYSYCGINLKGQANATKIQNCRFTSVTNAVLLESDGVAAAFANGVVLSGNDFEGVTKCVVVNTTGRAASDYMPTGLRVNNSRIESGTTFFEISGAATAINDHSHPPILRDNYYSVGSLTNFVVNAKGQRLRVDEPSYYGTSQNNEVGGPANYRVRCEGAGKNFRIFNESDQSDYNSAHLILGGYHVWIDDPGGGAGKLRMKWGVPTSDTDGTVVGTQT